MMSSPTSPTDVLRFWFEPTPGENGPGRIVWFKRDDAFDRAIIQRFAATYDAARRGALDAWHGDADGTLALIIVLDQFPRNMFRDGPEAFATDAPARAVAGHALAAGFDMVLPPVQRWFAYLPFMHSELLADQERCVALFAPLQNDPVVGSAYGFAIRHRDVIARFGRFPHRNAALARQSTPDEIAFLREPGSRF